MGTLGKALVAVCLSGAPLALFAGDAASTDAEAAARARQLVQALSSDSFSERSIARRELEQLGRPAIEPLEYAAQSDDTETRITATQLLLAMRGRGFMGIGLQEEQPGGATPMLDEDPAADAKPVPPPVVNVTMIPNGRAKAFPAELAGVSVGDKVLQVNGRRLCGVKDLMREVINIGPGRVALVMIDREGKKLRLPILLTQNPNDTPAPIDLEKESLESRDVPVGNKSEHATSPPAVTGNAPKDDKDLKAVQATIQNDSDEKPAVKK